MKKPLFAVCLVILIVGSFLAGVYNNKGGSGKQPGAAGERRVLYYVDPMNPAHTSDKPGVAPCGMAMEPVYDDEGSPRQAAATAAMVMAPGTVKIPPQKQQVIGVQLGTVEVSSETHTVRTLGRVAADEDRIFPLTAATDGWMEVVHGGTTGSMVMKDQLLGQLEIYTNDFFTLQQQYLTYAGRLAQPGTMASGEMSPGIVHPGTPRPRVQQPWVRQPAAGIPGAPQPAAPQLAAPQPATPQQGAAMQTQLGGQMPAPMPHGTAPVDEPHPEAMQPEEPQPEAAQPEEPKPEGVQPEEPQIAGVQTEEAQPETPQAEQPEPQEVQHNGMQHHAQQPEGQSAEAQIPRSRQLAAIQSLTKIPLADYYTYRAKLELLNLGIDEAQLEELVRTGQYWTHVKIRSPVTGLVVARSVSPHQRVEKGKELFKIADLSRIWIVADVFNTEADYIRPGMRARVSLPRHQRSYEATVSEVPSQFDPATRSLKVRLEADNPDFELRPEMFVDVEFLLTFPPAITVPAEAVLDSGRRKTVFVASGNGFFEPRRVATGWRFGNRVEIVEGLMPGEQIVVSGNFLVDSESRMKLAASGLFGTPEIDPVCGMDVYPARAKPAGLTSEFGGKTYYFCEQACKAQFDKDHDPNASKPAVGAQKPDAAPGATTKTSIGIIRDPVCRMVLHEGKARAAGLTAEYEGKTQFFCSKECKEEFEKAPQRYLDKGSGDKPPQAAPGHGGHKHD